MSRQIGMHIGGKEVAAVGGQWFDTVDPFTGQVWAEVARGDTRDVERAVASAHAAFADGPVPADRNGTRSPPASTR